MVLRRWVSLLSLGVLLLSGYGYLALDRMPVTDPLSEAPPRVRPEPFHRHDRARFEWPAGNPRCLTCHPALAHWRDPKRRSFLNLHQRSLDCGVCHLRGRGVGVRHFRDLQVVTRDTLPGEPYGRIFAAVTENGEWRKVLEPGEAARLRVEGPACATCHRRGSPLLATDGLFDPYRRRILEDLSVLRYLREEKW